MEIIDVKQRISAAIRPLDSSHRTAQLVATWQPIRGLCHFPPVLGELMGDASERLLGPEGTLYTYTRVHATRHQPEQYLGFVDFEQQVRVMGRLQLPEGKSPQIGQTVRVEARGTHPDATFVFCLE